MRQDNGATFRCPARGGRRARRAAGRRPGGPRRLRARHAAVSGSGCGGRRAVRGGGGAKLVVVADRGGGGGDLADRRTAGRRARALPDRRRCRPPPTSTWTRARGRVQIRSAGVVLQIHTRPAISTLLAASVVAGEVCSLCAVTHMQQDYSHYPSETGSDERGILYSLTLACAPWTPLVSTRMNSVLASCCSGSNCVC
jgi:hypothetical protein